MAKAKYIRAYKNSVGIRYYLLLSKWYYIPAKYRRAIKKWQLNLTSEEKITDYAFDYPCLRLDDGLYQEVPFRSFLSEGMGLKIDC